MNSEQLLSQEFVKSHPIDVAKVLEQLPVEQTLRFLTETPSDLSATVVRVLSPLTAASCLDKMDAEKAAPIVRELTMAIAAALLRRLDELHCSTILKSLPDEMAASLRLLLEYPENSGGALMNPQVFTLFDDITVKEALRLILRKPKHVFYHIPVINRDHALVGLTDISNLIISKPEELISAVAHTGVGQLSPNSYQEVILAHPDWKLYHDLPVVDEKGLFLGVIGYQIVRRLENEIQNRERDTRANDAGKALGELYWIGMSAIFKGAASIVNPEKESK